MATKKAVVQWAVKYKSGRYSTYLSDALARMAKTTGIPLVRISIREVPAKASKRKAVKRGKAK